MAARQTKGPGRTTSGPNTPRGWIAVCSLALTAASAVLQPANGSEGRQSAGQSYELLLHASDPSLLVPALLHVQKLCI